jgi:Holliday junction DNA helicase RuvA
LIGRLTGDIIEKDPQQLVMDVGGVGYEVEIPLSTFYVLAEKEGHVTLFTHLVVRDDAHLLFGFASTEEREMFRTLIKVNGVGPKMAIAILSSLDAGSFAASILDGDLKTLTGLPGVGKKTAERLIIEMRDKVSSFSVADASHTGKVVVDVSGDAEAALIGLGYRPQEASLAISQIDDPAEDIETLIKQALKHLMKG